MTGWPSLNQRKIISTSEQLLLAVRRREPLSGYLTDMEALDLGELLTDDEKLCFWINVYNAWYQLLAREGTGYPEIFSQRKIRLGGHAFSLDEVEHGILRQCRWKYGLGYLPDLSASSVIRRLAVEKPDYRVHFALNCGAASCPPILHYSLDRIGEQLEMAEHSFLLSSSSLDHEKKTVSVSRIMFWFIGDFGGRSGIRKLMSKAYGMDLSSYGIRFKPYNWEVQLDAFVDQDLR
jgi:hypothetical protein